MTEQEAKAMLGTEFTYTFKDGDTIQAYVKAYDPDKGLTCYSLTPQTDRDQWSPEVNRGRDVEPDGTFCVMGFPAEEGEKIITALQGIKDTGVYSQSTSGLFSRFTGCQF